VRATGLQGQLVRFAVVGLASNVSLYLAYLLITALGVGHKTAMTVMYATGVCMTFMFNRRWTFAHRGRWVDAFAKYGAIYVAGYVANWAGLFLFVDKLALDHRIVQGCLVILVALLMFIAQKHIAFGGENAAKPGRIAAEPPQ
jgi:putative flippase GtrA